MTLPLDVSDVTVDYGGLRALEGVSLEVPAGRCVALIGPNGAGKTTLFDAVTGIVHPSSGAITLFGRDVRGWPVHRRAQLGVGRTFQRLELFGSLSVEDNVIVSLGTAPSEGKQRAAGLLELVGLREVAGARAGDLPMGLARMCELARVLARDPRLLLLDEPSSGCNDEETRALADLLRRLRQERGLSVLVVEHDMSFVLTLCDEVYVLDFGKVIANGTPDEVRSDPDVQAAYLGREVTA